MARKETRVQRIVRLTAKKFSTLAEEVIIEQVVRFVLAKRNAIENAQRQKVGDDARDYVNTSCFLKPLSSRDLDEITHFKHSEIRQRLRNNDYPFWRLNKKTRETLLSLHSSWVREGANWLLDVRGSRPTRTR